ncbi:hypothetical protein EG328_008095 [Venturia inaequalis]|uniref:BTB domain-containing protein n=2 Tax=Venturia inaequalis TaxID=5025 RepID=A0A8H3UF57_VENIN|nr:hypothetical protein EG328_008095 [Venturia inaequalis]RDI76742.1 hypothetical protein Vi05172_g13259 [Venturia inaequalis]
MKRKAAELDSSSEDSSFTAMADDENPESYFSCIQNVTVEVERDQLKRSFIVPEALLRRASKVLAGDLDKISGACKSPSGPSLRIETTPLAFGELLMFLYHGKVIDYCHGNYDDVDDLPKLLIDVCALAEKLDMPDLYNHALGVLYELYFQIGSYPEDLIELVHRAYAITPNKSTLRKLTMMFLARERLHGGIDAEDSHFVQDIKGLLDAEANAEAKCAEYIEQLIKVALYNQDIDLLGGPPRALHIQDYLMDK